MPTQLTPQVTDFTRDVLGRYICNGLDEALASTDSSRSPQARPFDIIVLGGGTFGVAVAQHAFFRHANRGHRILLLEGGPFVLPEHVQNLPVLGLAPPGATSIADLRGAGQDRTARNEVWGLAWHSATPFPGLAYCLGGRSLFWGGWSPEPIATELPSHAWPASVLADLDRGGQGDLYTAARQIGVDVSNDFIFGPFHEVLRKRLLLGIRGGVFKESVPLAELPLQQEVPDGIDPDLLRVEAPLAVQGRAPRSGYFPVNKFSTVPLLIRAARMSYVESGGDDTRKRLMVVPHCHVRRLVTDNARVTGVDTGQGIVPVSPGATVVIALGTIESTRLALTSFGNIPGQAAAGRNLMAHLRSNLTIRIPRASLRVDLPRELQASALFFKGRHRTVGDVLGHFHLQITAAGLGPVGTDSEAELFKKIPDVDTFDRFLMADDTHVVMTLRGIGEMQPANDQSSIVLDSETDEYGVRRALVRIAPSPIDLEVWDAMDAAADEAAIVFSAGGPYDVLRRGRWEPVPGFVLAASVLPFVERRDGLGTTHHEAGTLRMGTDPTSSVTDADARIHGLTNVYVAGPALFPTVGSPNPMLTGLALSRRLARHLVPDTITVEEGFSALFDGATLAGWRMAGPGTFVATAGTLRPIAGNDIGLLWHTTPLPADFLLRLEWRRLREDDNSGVFLRFPDPDSRGYQNPAFVGVHFGYEVQIDEHGLPDGADIHRTGAIYGQPDQVRAAIPARPVGEWNEFEIRVVGQFYEVLLNGTRVTEFTNADPARALRSSAATATYAGIQAYPGRQVEFRNIRIREASPTDVFVRREATDKVVVAGR